MTIYFIRIINSGAKIVFFDRCFEDIGASCVSVNDRDSTKQITEHLIVDHGYTKIAHISGPQKVSIGKKRLQGFVNVLEVHDIEIKKDRI